jgi:hypothetical protein
LILKHNIDKIKENKMNQNREKGIQSKECVFFFRFVFCIIGCQQVKGCGEAKLGSNQKLMIH